MQWRVRLKNILNQGAGERAFDARTGAHEIAKPRLLLKHDQRADATMRKRQNRRLHIANQGCVLNA